MKFTIECESPDTEEYEFYPSCSCNIIKIDIGKTRDIPEEQCIHVLFEYLGYHFDVDIVKDIVMLQDIINSVRDKVRIINKKIEDGEL